METLGVILLCIGALMLLAVGLLRIFSAQMERQERRRFQRAIKGGNCRD